MLPGGGCVCQSRKGKTKEDGWKLFEGKMIKKQCFFMISQKIWYEIGHSELSMIQLDSPQSGKRLDSLLLLT